MKFLPDVDVSTGYVSCYPASMVNLIWFADEECALC